MRQTTWLGHLITEWLSECLNVACSPTVALALSPMPGCWMTFENYLRGSAHI